MRRSTPHGLRLARTLTAVLLAALTSSAAGTSAAAATAPAVSTASRPVHYVALGDSYAAGPGVAPQLADSGACSRSAANYPHRVAAALQVSSFTDVSCSGATTTGVLSGEEGHPAQLLALSAQTTLVTITIGGNDADLVGLLRSCVLSGLVDPSGHPCRTYYVPNGVDTVRLRLLSLTPRLYQTLRAVQQAAPNARVVLVGYPQLVAPARRCPQNSTGIGAQDLAWVNGVGRFLDRTWAATAAVAGVQYVSTAVPGHDACQAPGVRWVEGVSDVRDSVPLHPNGLGMQAIADRVTDRVAARVGGWNG